LDDLNYADYVFIVPDWYTYEQYIPSGDSSISCDVVICRQHFLCKGRRSTLANECSKLQGRSSRPPFSLLGNPQAGTVCCETSHQARYQKVANMINGQLLPTNFRKVLYKSADRTLGIFNVTSTA
jgi:hypothetical protein